MKTHLNTLTILAVVLGGLVSAGTAAAGPGTAALSTQLPAASRTELRANIDKARVANPSVFQSVRAIASHAREEDKRARGRKAPIAQRLANLGSAALLPMLELVAFDAPSLAAGETAADRASVQRDLVEAIGLLRDPRAMPVLVTVLARDVDFESTRGAAEAVARLESAVAASTLVAALDSASGERASAILAGMGACHRTVVARALAGRLASVSDDATARIVVKALGHVGNAWAWKTLGDRSEETATREAAARALVVAYVRLAGDVREAAAKAILVVDDPHTDSLVAAARQSATPEQVAALDALARRLGENPTH